MPRAKLSDAQPIPPSPQGGKASLSDATSVNGDVWNSQSHEDREKYLNSLSAEDRVKFSDRMGMFGHKGISVSAPPKTGSIPWMKAKAYSMLGWGANQLPTVEGTVGGVLGGLVGGAIDVAGGEVGGALVGAGLGGAVGESHRQRIGNWMGDDKDEDPSKLTPGYRAKEMVKEGAYQAAGEAFGMGAGKVLRPTLERSLAKLYYAGGIKYGNPLGPGDLERVMGDLIATEKAGSGKATTVGDLLGVINQTKKDVGQEVDLQLALPTTQGGKTVMLGQAHANSAPIVNAITAKATDSPSIIKMAQLNPAGKEALYLEKIRREALAFQQHPWTYAELTDRRIHLNQELAPIYSLPPGEQRVYLLEHPDLAYKKAEAEAIRDVIYPTMDKLSNKPAGTTAAMQEKRGALMSLENQVNEHLSNIKTKARQAKGAPPLEKTNISTYGTTGGKPGLAVHRLTGLVHTPNPEAKADKQVARAFGNTVGSKVRSAIASPLGSDKLGNELLSLPLRELVNPSQKKKPEDDSTSEEQSSVARPRDLIEKAKQMNPSAQGQVAYNHTAVNPATGHRIGSHDGRVWFDHATGEQVA